MIAGLMLVAAQTADTNSPLGRWSNPSGSVSVAIAPCGDALCGRVESASDKAKADARKGGTDPLVGVELLSGFTAAGDGRWKGRLFIPDLNRRSRAELTMIAPDQLKVTGCAVGRVVCKSQIWVRAAN
jgi:uncharacterized protein (DUF2147 family)